MGYTGGDTVDPPTYRSVCRNDGHTEAIRLEFDPTVLSFEELMRTFFEDPHVAGYYPGASAEKPQYMSAVWALSAEQATKNRGAFVAAVYAELFDWIVQRINAVGSGEGNGQLSIRPVPERVPEGYLKGTCRVPAGYLRQLRTCQLQAAASQVAVDGFDTTLPDHSEWRTWSPLNTDKGYFECAGLVEAGAYHLSMGISPRVSCQGGPITALHVPLYGQHIFASRPYAHILWEWSQVLLKRGYAAPYGGESLSVYTNAALMALVKTNASSPPPLSADAFLTTAKTEAQGAAGGRQHDRAAGGGGSGGWGLQTTRSR